MVLCLCGNVIALFTQGGADAVFLDPDDRRKWGQLPLSPASIVCFFSQPRSPTLLRTLLPVLLKEPLRPSSWAAGSSFMWSVLFPYTLVEKTAFLSSTPIAWGAHIGGFLGGIILGPLLLSSLERRRRRPTVDIVPFMLNRPTSLLR